MRAYKIHVLKWESRFTLGLDAAEITDYIKKMKVNKNFDEIRGKV